MSWDSPEMQAFAAGLTLRRLIAAPSEEFLDEVRPGDESLAFAARLEEGMAGEEPPEPRAVQRPPGLSASMHDCQKPFHLWNVERVRLDGPYQLEAREGLQLGRAVQGLEWGMPRQVERSCDALRRLESDRELAALAEASRRAERRQVWSEPLPFGRADDEELPELEAKPGVKQAPSLTPPPQPAAPAAPAEEAAEPRWIMLPNGQRIDRSQLQRMPDGSLRYFPTPKRLDGGSD